MSTILDVPGFLNSLESVSFSNEKDYQKKINAICKKELDNIRSKSKSLTQGDFPYSIGTLRRYRTDLRNAVRNHYRGKDLPVKYRDKDGAMTHIAVKYLTLKKTEIESYKEHEESRKSSFLDVYDDNRLVITDYQEMIKVASDLLLKDNPYDIALGLLLTTGRRSVEIWKTAKFSRFKRVNKTAIPCDCGDKAVAKTEVLFSGQAKTGGSLKVRKAKAEGKEIPEKVYPIFTLVNPDLVINALARLRAMKDFSSFDERKVNSLTSSMMSRLVKDYFNRFILKNDNGKLVKYGFIEVKDLRSCYVHCAHRMFARHSTQNRFATQMLGHTLKITSDNYMIFRLKDDDEK